MLIAIIALVMFSTPSFADEVKAPICTIKKINSDKTSGTLSIPKSEKSKQVTLKLGMKNEYSVSCQQIESLKCSRPSKESFKRIGAWSIVGGAVGFFLLPALGPIAPLTAAGISSLGAGGGSWLSGGSQVDRAEEYCPKSED